LCFFLDELCLRSNNKLVNVLVKTFKDIANEREEFFSLLIPYFTKEEFQKDSKLWSQGSSSDCIYVVEQGQLRIISRDDKTNMIEPLTMVGELGFFAGNQRQTSLVTTSQCVLWKMDQFAYMKIMIDNRILGIAFMKLAMKFHAVKLNNLNNHDIDLS